VLPCALVKYIANRMADDDSTAWFRVQHCLKPLRPLKKKKYVYQYLSAFKADFGFVIFCMKSYKSPCDDIGGNVK